MNLLTYLELFLGHTYIGAHECEMYKNPQTLLRFKNQHARAILTSKGTLFIPDNYSNDAYIIHTGIVSWIIANDKEGKSVKEKLKILPGYSIQETNVELFLCIQHDEGDGFVIGESYSEGFWDDKEKLLNKYRMMLGKLGYTLRIRE